MKILAVDVGTGTQDILLYDSRLNLENSLKLIVPSPTMIVRQHIRQATRRGEAVALTGVTMGGGPNSWAAEDHIKAGLPLYATPPAARSFNDDLDKVQEMGVQLVSEDEAARLPESVCRIELRDFDFAAIAGAFAKFGVALDDLTAVAAAVFDHGNAPPDVSDRQFRFDYLDRRIRTENRLSAFAYLAENIPPSMTRLQAVAQSVRQSAQAALEEVPLVVMDTAPAAVLGATYDPLVRQRQRVLIANMGNFHTLAFRLRPGGIEGVFEHHTGFLDQPKLDRLLTALAEGALTHAEVFNDHGHGALIYEPLPLPLETDDFGVVVTGPRRSLMHGSTLRPYFAVPFGDMMIAGCFGLLSAAADLLPDLGQVIRAALQDTAAGAAPWDGN
ncbi:MAG: hypothetical protein B6D39_04715 [Anaerolineae bacterium UTCFX2]|jgi:uncharacterized protein (DUF1786 family)|nr:DUF1786 domain-containing protein [Anaerolineae bacterium]MCZ7551838.1 DUF1786 domain-containing protein [Anaerolineales bacterium]OQY92622.1 MAG: hypothetical protein B6D39_04715 [Anaerolineae bacterium UTCFX2]